MSAMLNAYGGPVETYPDGSRELTREERIAQLRWEITRYTLERGMEAADIAAREYDLAAGDETAGRHIALCRQSIEQINRRIADRTYELNNLTRANAPRSQTGD